MSNELLQTQQQVYERISTCQAECLELLRDSRLSLLSVTLNNQFNNMKARFRTTAGGDALNDNRRRFDPLVPAPRGTVVVEGKPQKSAPEGEKEAFDKEVAALYETFADREPGELLDALTDLQVRGVALMAGLQFTETSPEKIDVKVVEDIQAAIRKQRSTQSLLDDPQGVLKATVAQHETQLAKVQTDKTTVEQSLEVETKPTRRAKLSQTLEELTHQEIEITQKIEELKAALQSDEDPAQ